MDDLLRQYLGKRNTLKIAAKENFWTDLPATENQCAIASVYKKFKGARTESGMPRAGHGPENCKMEGDASRLYQACWVAVVVD